jgi:hypothetical protein
MMQLIGRRLWPIIIMSGLICFGEAFAHDWLEAHIGRYPTEILVSLALSTLAAFIFYLFVDVNRRWLDARAIAPYKAGSTWLSRLPKFAKNRTTLTAGLDLGRTPMKSQ